MFLSKNKKTNVYPCKPRFYYLQVGFKGVKIIQACFRDASMVLRVGDASCLCHSECSFVYAFSYVTDGGEIRQNTLLFVWMFYVQNLILSVFFIELKKTEFTTVGKQTPW